MRKQLYLLIAAMMAMFFALTSVACGGGSGNKGVGVTSVTVAPSTATLAPGATQQLMATVAPANATNPTVTWSSGNTAVATVNSTTGLVTAVAAGNATITAKADGKTGSCAITVTSQNIPVESVSIAPSTATLAPGATQQLTATVAPANATNKTVTWSSGNTAVATVNSATGLVTAVAAGNTTIIATADGKTGSCAITVTPVNIPIPVESVTVAPSTATLAPGATQQLTATVAPANATNKTVTWSSGNTAVATVNPTTGLVTAVAAGNATIIATADGKTGSCSITVTSQNIPVESVTVAPSTATLAPGATQQLTATVAPANATNPTVTWSSGNTAVATVNSATGLVMAVAAGNATITATADGKSGSCAITVTSQNIPVTSVSVYPTSATIQSLQSVQLTATVYPENATNKNVTWVSAALAIANVSTTGLVTGTGTGATLIRVDTVDGGKEAFCTVTVIPIAVTGVSISRTSATIRVNETLQLNATVMPYNAANQNVNWESSNQGVATVTQTGLVTSLTEGSTAITVRTAEGNFSATCNLTVSNTISVEPDVYVAGVFSNYQVGTLNTAAYWKNGTRVILLNDSQISDQAYGRGHSIFVDEADDVYVAGYTDDARELIGNPTAWKNIPVLWKNDSSNQTILNPPSSSEDPAQIAYSVFVSGGIQYVAATANIGNVYTPMLFRNGTLQTLSTSAGSAQAESVFVSNGIPYVAGIDYPASGVNAVVWEGNNRHTQQGDKTWSHSVFVSGADVYVGGSHEVGGVETPAVWKNNQLLYSYPTTGFSSGFIRSVYVVGSDVYATGGLYSSSASRSFPMVWKNGQLLYELATPGSSDGQAYSIFVHNDKVYVAGGERLASWQVTLWVNGQPTRISPGGANDMGYSVFVKDSQQAKVYVAGTIEDGVSSNNLSYLWTNTTPQKLNVTGNESDASSVFVSDNGTTYVAGYEYTVSGTTIPTLYVNGTATELVTPSGYMYPYVYSVFVADNVAYAVGYIRGFTPYGNYAMLWEGDTPKVIGTQEGRAFSVYVDEGKVYVAGYEGNSGSEKAALWVNDALTYLQASAGCRATANSVFASGDNVYVAGYEWDQNYDYAALWINGDIHRLPVNSTQYVRANSVYVSGGKAYVAGYDYDSIKYTYVAKIWEITLTPDGGGIQNTSFHELTDGTSSAKANSVFVVEGDIYAAGYEAPGWIFRATVWKVSGQAVTTTRLSETESEAKCVFVR